MTSPASPRSFTLNDFDFELPPELIAQHPSAERSGSRLLDGAPGAVTDRIFRDLPGLLNPGERVGTTGTWVVNARIVGEVAPGGSGGLLFECWLQGTQMVVHRRGGIKPLLGGKMHLAGGANQGGFDAVLLGRWPDENGQLFHLQLSDEPHALMEKHGVVPLPPYIERPAGASEHADTEEDEQRYQTVFARAPGAVAAPTAALHFDEGVLAALAERGVQTASVTLHVGAGTFQPVKTENIAEHTMHSEWYEVPAATQTAIAACKASGGRVLAVGTTTVRTLESWAHTGQASGDTAIFITPGFAFKVVDLLQTNFHLPKSTLMMLISAFAGHAHVMALYRHAIAQRYRFFSYGDAMLLSRDPRE